MIQKLIYVVYAMVMVNHAKTVLEHHMDLHMKMSVEHVILILQMTASKIVLVYGVGIQNMIYVEFVAVIIQAVLIVQELLMDLLM